MPSAQILITQFSNIIGNSSINNNEPKIIYHVERLAPPIL